MERGLAAVDLAPYGSRKPGLVDRSIFAVTGRFPANWLGLRLAALFRRIVTSRLGDGGVDVERLGLKLRLYPRGNGCEKNLLFTPQMYDVVERRTLAAEADAAIAAHGGFVFVDIGANVGLYSLYLASHAGARAAILAVEPQPGIADRLIFNIAANPGIRIDLVREAVSDRDGEAELVIDQRDGGGTHLQKGPERAAQIVRVRCRPLIGVLSEHGIARIDALKIDVEGAEDLALGPFLQAAPDELLPRLIVIEDTSDRWAVDVFGLLAGRGYSEIVRTRHNVALRRGGAAASG